MQICTTVWCDCLSDVMFHSFFPLLIWTSWTHIMPFLPQPWVRRWCSEFRVAQKQCGRFFWRNIYISCIKISQTPTNNRFKVSVTRRMGDLLDEDWPSSNRGTRLPSGSFFYLAKWIRLSLHLFCVYFLWIYRVLYVPQCCHFLCR